MIHSSDASDPYNLDRFVQAQANSFDNALAEITSGQKRTHWMWFIFPQIDGLALSPTSKYYAIKSLDEARAYLAHPRLGSRLRQCTEALLHLEARSAAEVLGFPDDLKLKSSATLFALVSEPGSVFERVLDKYFAGARDGKTLDILNANSEH